MITELKKCLFEYERPKRRALSSRFPFLVWPIIAMRRFARGIYNKFTLKRLHQGNFLPTVVARHSSPLYRKLGDGNERLQINKVINLKCAIAKLNGLIIPPGETFSFWNTVGRVSRKRGYVEGMLLSNGKVSEGIGGGLCQLSNFLFWILLHAETEILERYHHSVDVFPDSGRTLPFGSGATIFSNYIDLKVRNTSVRPLQIKLWLTEDSLKGQLLSDESASRKFHIREQNHLFLRKGDIYFRYNEMYREAFENGVKKDSEKIVVNFVPVIYLITEDYLKAGKYDVMSV